jgi:hypothetical protein
MFILDVADWICNLFILSVSMFLISIGTILITISLLWLVDVIMKLKGEPK